MTVAMRNTGLPQASPNAEIIPNEVAEWNGYWDVLGLSILPCRCRVLPGSC